MKAAGKRTRTRLVDRKPRRRVLHFGRLLPAGLVNACVRCWRGSVADAKEASGPGTLAVCGYVSASGSGSGTVQARIALGSVVTSHINAIPKGNASCSAGASLLPCMRSALPGCAGECRCSSNNLLVEKMVGAMGLLLGSGCIPNRDVTAGGDPRPSRHQPVSFAVIRCAEPAVLRPGTGGSPERTDDQLDGRAQTGRLDQVRPADKRDRRATHASAAQPDVRAVRDRRRRGVVDAASRPSRW